MHSSAWHIATIFVACLPLLVSAIFQSYIVYPADNLDKTEIQAVTDILNKLAGGSQNVYASWRPWSTAPAYWIAKLPDSALDELRNAKGVAAISPDADFVELEDANESLSSNNSIGTTVLPAVNDTVPIEIPNILVRTKSQKNAPIELRVISQPEDKRYSDISHYSDYVYETDAGEDVYIYHAELGINVNHKDFQDRPGAIEWIYTPRAERERQNTETEYNSLSPDGRKKRGHSTCTASKAAGNIGGSAKYSTLVVVKAASDLLSAMLESLPAIYLDVAQKNRRNKSIVTISWSVYWKIILEDTRLLRDMETSLQKLSSLGVIVICAAGNHALQKLGSTSALRTNVDTYPAMLTDYTIAVGNCDNHGRRRATSQTTSDRQVYAPAVNIQCADVASNDVYRTSTGTSYSAPLTAGVVAQRLGALKFPQTAPRIRDMLVTESCWRRPNSAGRIGGEYVIYNGIGSKDNPGSTLPVGLNILNSSLLHSDVTLTA